MDGEEEKGKKKSSKGRRATRDEKQAALLNLPR